ncbi:MAG: Endonuclease/Exonuclease/phosphatase family protein [Myxococcales bacterium]|nr:Endonuclease/Exonuclease/phosphatase family protein [Myxococcales bacterium]
MKARWFAAAAAVAVFALRSHAPPRPPIRFATFNIEDFPKHARQVAGAFDDLERLDASFIAVQEIGDPELLRATAQQRLGPSWAFVHEVAANPGDVHLVGLLFDTREWTFLSSQTHDETRLGTTHKPALEVRLRSTDDGAAVRVIIVHLRSGTPGRGTRIRQHEALRGIVRRAAAAGERVVVLGDFNATEAGDRTDLAELAADTGLVWATEALACSAYWSRADGCPSSRLDHVLSWRTPLSVESAGECARSGCEWQDRCPIYTEQVSDHCPVVVAIP